MTPLAAILTCLGIFLTAGGLGFSMLHVAMAAVHRVGGIEATFTAAVAELRKSVDELREGLKQIVKIPLLEQRVGMLEGTVSGLSRGLASTDKFRAVAETEIEHVKRRLESSPDLAHFASPTRPTLTIPRTDP
jgi:hypothetical protein